MLISKYRPAILPSGSWIIRYKLRITNLGDSVNGTSSNFKAVISGDGLTMAYMNELPFYEAVYVSRYTGTGWTAPVNITPQIQSDGDQYVSSISYDGTRLYLTREDAFNSDIYTTDFQNGKWTKSQPITGQILIPNIGNLMLPFHVMVRHCILPVTVKMDLVKWIFTDQFFRLTVSGESG